MHTGASSNDGLVVVCAFAKKLKDYSPVRERHCEGRYTGYLFVEASRGQSIGTNCEYVPSSPEVDLEIRRNAGLVDVEVCNARIIAAV